ncbi:MAG TPA: 2-oxo-4-hydroxy-4-carboxy-5-ureidoimidazoline decarboxylase [Chloroflexota bacterium]|nr:2-oxo-4-hydroxy-4-carboxy-5-ureidoimidazoline decarboxylase [Chloroflexota bacterium]
MARYTLAELNALDQAGFVAALGWVFEGSPWVAERAWAARPFASRDALHAALVAVVQAARPEEQLALIRAHPDLGTRLGRATLSAASVAEQAGAGLDRLSDAEFARFQDLNARYRERFGFPFIIAVRHHTRASILAAFEARLQHDAATERATALAEIAEIARLRLADAVAE